MTQGWLSIRRRVLEVCRSGPAWVSLLLGLALTYWGVEAIETVKPKFAQTQITRQLPLSLFVAFLCVLIPPRRLGLLVTLLYAFSVFLLIYLFIPGAPLVKRVNGATSWLNLVVMNFQPAELAKLTFVLMLAMYLQFRESHRTWLGLAIPFGLMLLPMGLILKQPDLGSALLFLPTLFVMLLAAGGKLRHQLVIVGSGALLAGTVAFVTINANQKFSWTPKATHDMHILRPHQEDRILALYYAWIGDDRMANDEGFQQARGMQLIGAGQVQGYGSQAGQVIRANALPEPHNDMIFCIIGNRWGLLGAGGITCIYGLLLGTLFWAAARCHDPFMRLSVVGFAAMLFAQAFINIAMCLGLMPITGITLPFVSYGGSSLLSCWAMLGLAINFASRPPPKMTRESFEFDG